MGARTIKLEWFEQPGPRSGSRDAVKSDAGLRFECSLCGACCTGPEGYVLVSDEECASLAAALGLTPSAFRERYTKPTTLGLSLIETETEHGLDCVFLDRERIPGKAVCGVYEQRPAQCRTWPFWKSNLSSERAWRRAAALCPGIDRGERVFEPDEIKASRSVVEI